MGLSWPGCFVWHISDLSTLSFNAFSNHSLLYDDDIYLPTNWLFQILSSLQVVGQIRFYVWKSFSDIHSLTWFFRRRQKRQHQKMSHHWPRDLHESAAAPVDPINTHRPRTAHINYTVSWISLRCWMMLFETFGLETFCNEKAELMRCSTV